MGKSSGMDIIALVDKLKDSDNLEQIADMISEKEYQVLLDSIQDLGSIVYKKAAPDPEEERRDELMHMMTSIANLDFSREAFVSEREDILDFIAIGLNLMNVQLRKHFQAFSLYQQAFQATSDLVLITGPSGNILQANPAACRYFKKDELTNADIFTLFKGYPLQSILEEKGVLHNYELADSTKRSRKPTLSLSVDPLALGKGQSKGYVFSIRTKVEGLAGPNDVKLLRKSSKKSAHFEKAWQLMQTYKYWDEWVRSDEFEALGYSKRELLILDEFIKSKGNFDTVAAIFNLTVPRIKQIIDKTFRKLNLNHIKYQRWVLDNKLIIPFSKQDLDTFKDQIIFNLTKNIFGNYPDITQEFFTANMLKADFHHFNLSDKLLAALNELNCGNAMELLDQYPDPVIALSEHPSFTPSLLRELKSLVASVNPQG